jgi:hypothetical protein
VYITLCVLDAAGSTAGDPRDAWGTQLVERYEQGKNVRIQSKTKANQSKSKANQSKPKQTKEIPKQIQSTSTSHCLYSLNQPRFLSGSRNRSCRGRYKNDGR